MPGNRIIDELEPQKVNELSKNFKKVSENTELLEKAKNEAEILELNVKNPEINLHKMSTSVIYFLPDYLKNPKEKIHKQRREEIDLYVKSFENIGQQINDCIDKAFVSLNNLKNPAMELNNEINEILKNFNDTKKNLCAPFCYEEKGLENINNLSESNKKIYAEVKKKMDEFVAEANKLYEYYYDEFKPIKEDIKYVCNSIEIIPKPINILKDTILNLKKRFENTLETISDKKNNVHSELLDIKRLFSISKEDKKTIVNKMDEEIEKLEKKNEKKKIVNSLKQEIVDVIKSLTEKSKLIKNDIKKINPEANDYQSMVLKLIDVVPANEKIMKICNQIPEEAKVISKEIKVVEQEEKLIKETSLDLLYLMDITGSMEAYVDQTKKELINIMNKIIEKFNGIDINLGFIGYKDIEEHLKNDFIDEDFTKNYDNIKQSIQNVEISGGEDIAEDIAWAFEKALNKNWTSNARFAIFAGDAPCHGLKYHDHEDWDDYPDGIAQRKDIEESIRELCVKGICLFCIKITDKTDKMFDIFKDIYIQQNKESNFFIGEITNIEDFSKMIIEKCEKVYKMKRFEN